MTFAPSNTASAKYPDVRLPFTKHSLPSNFTLSQSLKPNTVYGA